MPNQNTKSGLQRAKMLEVARRLFWEKGYRATSMRDIALSYGCKPANIYNFFSDKEEILFEVLREEMEQILRPIQHLEDDSSMSATKQLLFLIECHLRVTLSYRRSSRLLFDVALNNLSPDHRKKIIGYRDAYDRIIRKVIHRGIETGEFDEVDVKLAGFMIASMITRTRLWYHPKKGATVAELVDFIFRFALYGLRGPDGRREEKR